MQIDLRTPLKDIRGEPLLAPDSIGMASEVVRLASQGRLTNESLNEVRALAQKVHGLTLKDVLLDALGNTLAKTETHPGDETMSGLKKIELYILGIKIYGSDGIVDLTVEQTAMLKTRVGLMFNHIVVGQVWPMLDGELRRCRKNVERANRRAVALDGGPSAIAP